MLHEKFISHELSKLLWATERPDSQKTERLKEAREARCKTNANCPVIQGGDQACTRYPSALHQWKPVNLSPKVATWVQAIIKKIISTYFRNSLLQQWELTLWQDLFAEADHHTSLCRLFSFANSSILPSLPAGWISSVPHLSPPCSATCKLF